MRNDRKNIFGFTLVETLIYMALIGVTLTSFISFALSISSLRNKNYAMQEVLSNSRVAMGIMTSKIRESKSVEIPAKGENSDNLRLIMPDDSTLTFSINQETKILEITEGVGEGTPIVSGKVVFSKLSFANLGEPEGKDSVKIELSAQFIGSGEGNNDFSYSQDVETAANVN